MQRADHRSVLFVSSTLSAGGAERFVSNVLGHLDRERFAPSLALRREESAYPLPEDGPVFLSSRPFDECGGEPAQGAVPMPSVKDRVLELIFP